MGQQLPHLPGQPVKLVAGQGLCPVGQGAGRAVVHLHHQAVGSGGHGGQRQGSHQLRPPGGVAGVHDHRQVGQLFQHRNGGNVQSGAAVGLEGTDAPLAQDHLPVAPGQDVLRRLQQLRHRGGHTPLQQHGLPDLAQGLEQGEILHIPGPDLQNIHLIQVLQLAGVRDLRHHRQSGLPARLRQHGNARLAQPLEGIGGRPGLEYPAPQQLRSGGLDPPGDPGHLHLRFHGAGSGDQAELRPDPGAAHLHHGVLRVGGAAGQAIGRRDAPHVQHIGQGRQTLRVQPPGVSHQGQHVGVPARGPADPHPLIHQAHRQLPQGGLLGVFLDNNDHMILHAAVPLYIPGYCTAMRGFLQPGNFPGNMQNAIIEIQIISIYIA